MEIKEHLQWLLEDWEEEIPTEMVHEGLYKVRGNWFQGVIADLEVGIEEGVIQDLNVITEARRFFEEYLLHDFDQRTSAEDIHKANTVIRKVLGKEEPNVS